jgi:hypothetical protein
MTFLSSSWFDFHLCVGVIAKLTRLFPHLVAIHCIAHRLALACKDASNAVDYIKKNFVTTVLQVAIWFDHSHVRNNDLRTEQSDNDEKMLKMIKMLEARWLSSERAVVALRQSLASVISVMMDPKRKKEAGVGCAKFLRSFRFIATLELFADTLPNLSHLSRVFQTRDLDFSAIASALSVTRSTITAKSDLASAVKAHLSRAPGSEPAAVEPAPAAEAVAPAPEPAPPSDPLMVLIEAKLKELRDRGIEIANDEPRMRKSFATIRAQWLRALLDQLERRFPATQLFADLATLFDHVKLPSSVAAASVSAHGREAISRLGEQLSQIRPALPPLDEQLKIVERKAAEHKKELKKKAQSKAKAASDADGDSLMAAADGDGKDGKDAKASSSASDLQFLDKAQLTAEWPSALSFLIDCRDSDPLLQELKKKGKLGTKELLRQFLLQPSNQRMFPQTVKLMCYALTLPVSTAECERTFSLMNLIKSVLRSRLTEGRLQDLMRCALGPDLQDKAIDWERVLYIWYQAKHRKVYLNLKQSDSDARATAPQAHALRVFVLPSEVDESGDVEML